MASSLMRFYSRSDTCVHSRKVGFTAAMSPADDLSQAGGVMISYFFCIHIWLRLQHKLIDSNISNDSMVIKYHERMTVDSAGLHIFDETPQHRRNQPCQHVRDRQKVWELRHRTHKINRSKTSTQVFLAPEQVLLSIDTSDDKTFALQANLRRSKWQNLHRCILVPICVTNRRMNSIEHVIESHSDKGARGPPLSPWHASVTPFTVRPDAQSIASVMVRLSLAYCCLPWGHACLGIRRPGYKKKTRLFGVKVHASGLNVLTRACCNTFGSAPCMSKVPHPVTSQLVPTRRFVESVEGKHTEPIQSSNGIGDSNSKRPKSKSKCELTLKDGWTTTRFTRRTTRWCVSCFGSWCHPPATTCNLAILQSLRKAEQCPAVSTHFSEINVPPQKCCAVPFTSERRLTCHFHLHSVEFAPCTIRFWCFVLWPTRP